MIQMLLSDILKLLQAVALAAQALQAVVRALAAVPAAVAVEVTLDLNTSNKRLIK